MSKSLLKKLIAGAVVVAAAILAGFGVKFAIAPDGGIELNVSMTGIKVPTLIMNSDGETVVEDIELVDNAEDGKIPGVFQSLGVDGLPIDSAVKGYTVDVSTPSAFIDATYGQCIYLNNPFGSQCYNTTALLMENQVGYWPDTCGTGAAKGIWECADYNSRGNGITWYYKVYNPWDLRPGDIVTTNNGIWGHTGEAAGWPFTYNGVWYVPLYSTNQGGANCELGGQASNIINMNLSTFAGALRWSGWDYLFDNPEPTPEPQPGNYVYQKGDYFSAVLMKLGLSDGSNLWGVDGDVNYYNEQLYKQGILEYRNGKYWNNIPIGTELVLEAR